MALKTVVYPKMARTVRLWLLWFKLSIANDSSFLTSSYCTSLSNEASWSTTGPLGPTLKQKKEITDFKKWQKLENCILRISLCIPNYVSGVHILFSLSKISLSLQILLSLSISFNENLLGNARLMVKSNKYMNGNIILAEFCVTLI